MRDIITEAWHHIRGDRPLIILCIVSVLLTLAYLIYTAIALAPTEIQIATRYTAFGETQYYRDKWYYLLSFLGFALVLMVTHIILAVKLYLRALRPIAIALGWLSIIMLVMLFIITRYVLGVAYL